MSCKKNLADVLYFDYILYKIVLAYHQTIYTNLRGMAVTIKDPNLLPDVLLHKNIASLFKNSLKAHFDEEINTKIVYVRVLQILDKNIKDDLRATNEVNHYLSEVKRNTNLSNIKLFKGTSEILDWLDELYSAFYEPFWYTKSMELLDN